MSFESQLGSSLSVSRSHSRASSRSLRAPSPSLTAEDPVAIRNQMSTLKHSIRHQQAQLQNLENVILRGPRPLPPGILSSPTTPMEGVSTQYTGALSPPPSYNFNPSSSPSTKLQRRTSFEVLHDLAGPDSQLPLPRPPSATPFKQHDGIKEGVPSEFYADSASPSLTRRMSSPTRTLSRIPVASVGHARTLAEEGQSSGSSLPSPLDASSSNGPPKSDALSTSTSSLQVPPSPNRRISLTGGNTSKVLADLQAGVTYTRNALENTKSQLRSSQRNVAQLTRQVEDLKESRERMRLENEGLNNVVARKERLLQEVLERARKAEGEAASLKTQLKSETTSSKKQVRDMEVQMSEAVATSQKAEREYITLRDALKQLSEASKADMDELRKGLQGRENHWQKEAEDVAAKYRTLLEEVHKEREEQNTASKLREDHRQVWKEWENELRAELTELKTSVERSERECEEAGQSARHMASELARLGRLLRMVEIEDSP